MVELFIKKDFPIAALQEGQTALQEGQAALEEGQSALAANVAALQESMSELKTELKTMMELMVLNLQLVIESQNQIQVHEPAEMKDVQQIASDMKHKV